MDKTTKILMAAIAAGLWANAAANFITPATAQTPPGDALRSIAMSLNSIATGICTNQKMC